MLDGQPHLAQHGMLALTLVVWAACWQPAVSQAGAQVAVVATAEAFLAAVDSGAEHIELTEHIDLTGFRGEEDPTGGDYGNKATLPKPSTRSIRGNCVGELPQRINTLRPPLRTVRRETQCVIVSAIDLFFFWNDAAYTVWLDNLFLRLDQKTSSEPTLLYWEPAMGSNSSLWLTKVTIECDGRDNTRAVFTKQGNTIFAQHSSFSHCKGQNAFFSHNTTLAFDQCFFDGNVCRGPSSGVLQLGNDTAAQLVDTGFGTTEGWGIFLEENTSFVYSDRHDDDLSNKPNKNSKGDILPLDAAPAALLFPAAEDPTFLELQNDVKNAARPPSIPRPSKRSRGPGAVVHSPHRDGGLIAGVVVAAVAAAILAAAVVLLLLRRRQRKRKSSAGHSSEKSSAKAAHSSGDAHVTLSSVGKSEHDDEPFLPPPGMLHRYNGLLRSAPDAPGGYRAMPVTDAAYVHPASYSHLPVGSHAPPPLPPQLSMQSVSMPLGHTIPSLPSDGALQRPLDSFGGSGVPAQPAERPLSSYNQLPESGGAPASLNAYFLQPPVPSQAPTPSHPSRSAGSWQAASSLPSSSQQVMPPGYGSPSTAQPAQPQAELQPRLAAAAAAQVQPVHDYQQQSIVGNVHSTASRSMHSSAVGHLSDGTLEAPASLAHGWGRGAGAEVYVTGNDAAHTITEAHSHSSMHVASRAPTPPSDAAYISPAAASSLPSRRPSPPSPGIGANGLVSAAEAVDGGGSSSGGASSTQGPRVDSVHTAAVQAAEGDLAALEYALDRLAMARPPGLFAGRFAVLADRAKGGQALVQFAREAGAGLYQYAIKFFAKRQDFEVEAALYDNPDIGSTLPPLHFVSGHGNHIVSSPSGYVYPPCLVMERGITCHEWLETQRSVPAILNMFYDLTKNLMRLHQAGYVHRDIKPANALWMLQTQQWKIIDFGIACKAGAEGPVKCSLGYASPESIRAFHNKKRLVVEPSQDIWALGVIVYEAISDAPAFGFSKRQQVVSCALGERAYAWEGTEGLNAAFARSRLRALVLPCLSRNAAERPTAAQLLRDIDRLNSDTQSTSAKTC